MLGLAGERATAAVVSWVPWALVTEMIAKRGSTASSKVSDTVLGGPFRTRLAAGEVLIR